MRSAGAVRPDGAASLVGAGVKSMSQGGSSMVENIHPAAPPHVPWFITGPGETDVLMVATGIFLLIAVLAVGNVFLRLHTLPERMAHKSQKLQFEIVAVLGLLALFTHQHIFWVAGLLLALVDLPDFGTPLRRIAGSTEKMAGIAPGEGNTAADEFERDPDSHEYAHELSEVKRA